MLLLLQLRECYHAITLLSLLWSSEGLHLAASYPSFKDHKMESQDLRHAESAASHAHKTPLLQPSEISGTLLMSSIAPQSPLPSTDSSPKSLDVTKNLDDPITASSATKELNLTSSSYFTTPSPNLMTSSAESSLVSHVMQYSSTSNVSYDLESDSTDELPSSVVRPTNTEEFLRSSSYKSGFPAAVVASLKSEVKNNVNVYSNFHTPLMSLLVAPSSIHSWQTASTLITSTFNEIAQSLTTTSSNNENANPNHLPVPSDPDHKKLLMLVLRAEDCTKFSKSDFEKMLAKLMVKFGFNDVVPEVSNAKCYSHLNINVTVGGPNPTLRFLPNMDGRNNYTVDVLNRTFRIVKLEKVDLKLEKTKKSNSSSNIIAAVADHESIAYIAVGVSFGLILVICVLVCCIKCCCMSKSPKRYGVPKGTHARLRPEDYTLTPIPRPNSLYVDYYRGSVTADIFSTASAGSIASTTPTVEQGVVQPFDTSIVPLEDSSNLPVDSSRDPSVESVPVQSDLKTFNIHGLSGKGLHTVTTDSKERLNPKANSRKVEIKTTGVANPTFQRY